MSVPPVDRTFERFCCSRLPLFSSCHRPGRRISFSTGQEQSRPTVVICSRRGSATPIELCRTGPRATRPGSCRPVSVRGETRTSRPRPIPTIPIGSSCGPPFKTSRRSVPQLVEQRTAAPEIPVVGVEPCVQCAQGKRSAELRAEKRQTLPDNIGVAQIDVFARGRQSGRKLENFVRHLFLPRPAQEVIIMVAGRCRTGPQQAAFVPSMADVVVTR